MRTKKKTAIALLCGAAAFIIWGFSFLASSVGQRSVTPFALLSYRFVFALFLMSLPVIFGRAKLKLRGKRVQRLLLLALLEPCLYFIGEQYGLKYSSSSFSGVMIAVIPVVTLLAAAVFLRERPAKIQWLFVLLSILGIVVITLSESSEGEVTLKGFLFLLFAVLAAAAFGVLNRSLCDEFSVFERTYMIQLMGAVCFTTLALIEYRGDTAALLSPLGNKELLLSALFLSVGASVLGYTLYNYAMANAPIANLMVLCNLTTVVSVLAGVVILKESFTLLSVCGSVIALVGIWGVQKYSPEK